LTERKGRWRLLVDAAADGAWNMAVDEAILDSYARHLPGLPPATLRLYGWCPGALSLGRGQPGSVGACVDGTGLERVRRPTGGWAVLHEEERTYAVVGHLGEGPFGRGVVATYRSISEALLDALGSLGAEVRAITQAPGRAPTVDRSAACFTVTSSHEIVVGERKLVGSAQLRRRGAFLQHGSIPIRSDARRLARLLDDRVDASRFVDLSTALGRTPTHDELDRALIDAFARRFGTELLPGALTPRERLHATRLRAWKHLSLGWVRDGRLSERETRHAPIS
jgi:lipoate-protein ligase A